MRKDAAAGIAAQPGLSPAAGIKYHGGLALSRHRKIQTNAIADEADTFLHNNDELKGIINSAIEAQAHTCQDRGDDFEPKVFNTFGPKAIAQIDKPQETIMDRGIIIEMRRKKPEERSERLRSDRIFEELKPLRQKAVRWAKDHISGRRIGTADSRDFERPSAGFMAAASGNCGTCRQTLVEYGRRAQSSFPRKQRSFKKGVAVIRYPSNL
jgi:hypothetical protein